MSWDIVLFNSKQVIRSMEDLDEEQLVPTDFTGILDASFSQIKKDKDHREIVGPDFSIEYFVDAEWVSNKMLSLYGENALHALIEVAKQHHWQIFDTGLECMLNLENPSNNGYHNHRKYVEQLMKN